jgi:hypothetical protein
MMKSLDLHQEHLLLRHYHLRHFSTLLQLELQQDNAISHFLSGSGF